MRRDVMRSGAFYDGLDAGIRFVVRTLHAHGIETGQSCQGGDGHAYDWPTVDLWADLPTTGFAAYHHLAELGLPLRDIARLWPIHYGELAAPFWRLTFREPMFDRQDDRPMFVWGYTADAGQVMRHDAKGRAQGWAKA